MALNDISLSISGDPAGAVNALRQTENAARQTADTVRNASGRMAAGMREAEGATGRMGQSMKDLQQLMAQLGAGFSLGMVVKQSLEAALAMERINAAMKATAGSGQAAARELQFIREESYRLGLEFSSTALAYAKFSASTKNTVVEGEATRKIFVGVSEAVTAMKLSGEESNGIFLALSQMMSKGKISAEELNGQLGERLPGALQLTADAMGMTTTKLLEQMQAGKLMSADVLPKLAEQLHLTYGAAAVEAAGQGQGGINRFNNSLFDTKVAMGTALLPTFTSLLENVIKPLMGYITMFIGGLEILAVKLASLPDKAAAAWKAIKSGEGLFSKNGLAMFDQQMSVIKSDENSVIADIMKKYTPSSSQKSAADLAAEQMKTAAAARRAAASTPKPGGGSAGSSDATAEYNKFVDAYNRMVDAIREGDPVITAEEKAVQKLKDQYENLCLKFPKQKAEFDSLYATHLKQIESLQALKKAVSDTSIEFQALIQQWDNQPAGHNAAGEFSIINDEILKLVDTLNGTDLADKFNADLRKMESMLEEAAQVAPEKVAAIIAAMNALKANNDNSTGLSALRSSNADLEIALMEDQFAAQQAYLDREYNAKKAAHEKELALASTSADKRSELEKALALEKKKYDQDSTKNSSDAFKSQLSMVANYAGTAAQLFSVMADAQDQSSREGFESAKNYNTAAAAMSMAAGIIGAFAGNGTMYEKLANAAIVLATGVAQISAIQSTSFGGGSTSASIPSGTTAGAGANGGGVAGSSIGARYVGLEDSQTTESMQRLADAADNASMAIGKIVDGFSKIASMFSEGGYASMFAGNAYGIDKSKEALASQYTSQNMSLFTSGTGLVANLLFGSGNKFRLTNTAMVFGGNSSNVTAQDVDEYSKKGGFFSGGKVEYGIKDDPEWAQFAQGLVTTIGTSVQRMAITMGTKAATDNIELPAAGIMTMGKTGEAISEEIQKWLQDVGAVLAGTIPELEKFSFAGENYYLALTRLNDALVSTNQAFEMIGVTLIQSTLEGANAAYKLQDLMGGSEAFAESIDTYFTSMFSDTQQAAMKATQAQRQVTSAFAEMGQAVPATKAEFVSLVNSLDLTNEAGAQTFAALMGVSEAFATVQDQADKAAETLRSYSNDLTSREYAVNGQTVEQQIFELQISQQDELKTAIENGMDTTRLKAVQEMEMAALQKRIMADVTAAATSAAQAAENAVASAQQAVLNAQRTLADMASKAQMDAMQSTADAYVQMANDLKNRLLAVLDIRTSATQALIDIMSGQQSTLSPTALYNQQKAAFAQTKTLALAGNEAALKSLPEMAKSFLTASQNYNASGTAYQADYAAVTSTLASISGLPDTATLTLQAAQSQLIKLEQIRAATSAGTSSASSLMSDMKGGLTGMQSLLNAFLQATVSAQQAQAAMAQAQLAAQQAAAESAAAAAQKALNDAAASKAKADADALAAKAKAEADAAAAALVIRTANSNAGAVSAIRAASTFNPDGTIASIAVNATTKALYDFNKNGILGDATDLAILNDILSGRKKWSDYSTFYPGYASGGDHLGGYRIVGEYGPELEATGPARIFSADQTSRIFQNGSADSGTSMREVLAELKALRAEVRSQGQASVRVAKAGFTGVISVGEKQAKNSETIANKTSLARQAA